MGQVAETHDPAEKHGGYCHVDGEDEMLSVRLGNQHQITAEAVYDHVDQLFMEPQLDIDVIADIHLEQSVGVVGEGFACQLRARDTTILGDLNVAHSVNPVMGDAVALGPGQQVAKVVVLTQAIGAGGVGFFPVASFALQIPVEIAESDLPVSGDGFLNVVHIIVDTFVHALDPAGNGDVTAHEPGIVDGALITELFDELVGFFLRQVTAGLHCINEQLQLRQVEISGGQVVAAVFAGDGDDIQTVILQCGNVGVDGFSVTADAVMMLQHLDQFRGSHGIVLVGVFLQIVTDVKYFQLLVVRFWHKTYLQTEKV